MRDRAIAKGLPGDPQRLAAFSILAGADFFGLLMPLSKISALMFSAVTTAGTKSSDGVL
jgi:hypothetical protein